MYPSQCVLKSFLIPIIVAFVGACVSKYFVTALWLAELTLLFLTLLLIILPMYGMQHASAAAECMSAGDFAWKFCEEGNYSDLAEAIRRAPTLSPDALLAIANGKVAGGDMQKNASV